MTTFSSFLQNSKIPIATGWRMFATGVFHVSYGGAIAFLHGMMQEGSYVVARTEEEALAKFTIQNPSFKTQRLKQDPDVLDTWFSSWLWPMAVFDTTVFKDPANKGNEDLNYYYPPTTWLLLLRSFSSG